MNAGIAWSTFFHARGWTWLPRMVYAYRAPSLFASEMSGLSSCFVTATDERWSAADYDGTTGRRAGDFEIVYLSAHGHLVGQEFELQLHTDNWRPAAAGLDGARTRIAVFDACNLVNPRDRNWAAPWTAHRRPSLRMVLGFASLATINKATALRGAEFADRLARGEPVATAWLAAVRLHSAHSADRPVAIGFGADAAEAQHVVDAADLTELLNLPALTGPPVARLRM